MALPHLKRAAIRMETAVRAQPEMVFMAASAVLILVRTAMADIMNIILKMAIWETWTIFSVISSEICSTAVTAKAAVSAAMAHMSISPVTVAAFTVDLAEVAFTAATASADSSTGFSAKGSDVKSSINVSFDEAAFGADKRISLSGPDGSSGAPQTLQIHIPAGIDTGKSIRLKGKGMPGTGGGEPGDLLLKVTVGTRPGYERKGSDVYTTISIPYTTAVFGGEATVPTLYGNVICKIRGGMQSGSRIRLRGKGIVPMKNPSVRGDQYVTIQIQVPQNLNYSAKEKLHEYARACGLERSNATGSHVS